MLLVLVPNLASFYAGLKNPSDEFLPNVQPIPIYVLGDNGGLWAPSALLLFCPAGL